MRRHISGSTTVAAVVGAPVAHSLSPLIHNAWIAAAQLNAVYVALQPRAEGFSSLVGGLRGGVVAGLNVTAPFKADALAVADYASPRARRAGAANVLLFTQEGAIRADNTDGVGLMDALARGAPRFDPAAGPVVMLGAGGVARGAAAALLDAGAPCVRLVNRSPARAAALATELGGATTAIAPEGIREALSDAVLIINATPLAPEVPLEAAPRGTTVMDMAYRPLVTPFLARATELGLVTIDGLAMLIGQARPSFAAFFAVPAPDVDVRAMALAELGDDR